jgi:hypothetical protein
MDFQDVGRELVLDRSGSGKGQVVVCCKGGNKLSVSIKCREFLD